MRTMDSGASALSIRALPFEQVRCRRTEEQRPRHAAHSPNLNQRTWHATYVLYEHILDYLACGWMVAIPNAAMPTHHSYGIVMEWRCTCKIVRPNR